MKRHKGRPSHRQAFLTVKLASPSTRLRENPMSLLSQETPPPPASPLVLSDRLISLAQDADRAGFAITADQLVHLAHTVLEEQRTH
jgi:hypothetical protein